MVTIDKGIPLPQRRGGAGAPRKWPFMEMGVGDSFLGPKKSAQRLTWGANQRHAPKKFTSRKTADGIRIWRIE